MDVEQAYRCGKCGICLQTCPMYQQTLDETTSPRAKMQLLKQVAGQTLSTSPHLQTILSRCLMCGNCTANCPSGVEHPLLFMQSRAMLACDYGEDWYKKVLYHFLTHEDRMRLAARFARFGRRKVLAKLDREIRIGNLGLKRLPAFNEKPFRDQLPRSCSAIGKERGTVLYFTGCGTQYLFDEVGHATVRVLRRLGFRVEIPNEQVCCGLPVFFSGDFKRAKPNILKNLEVLTRRDVRAVITDCATCGSALRSEYLLISNELELDENKAMALSEKVFDISEFLFDHLEMLSSLFQSESPRQKVTYHSPCHLRNFQKVESHVEMLLQRLPNVAYIRAADFNSCCGGGGTFFYDHPDISKKMVDAKISNAKATGARLWATGCPGCRINIEGNLPGEDRLDLCHPVQLVDKAIEKNREQRETR